MEKRFVRTVTGDIRTEKLGWCQCHEHIFLKKGVASRMSKSLQMEDYEKSKEELLLYQKAGGNAIVDAQPVFSGRMAGHLKRASEETGVKIVASTGFHKHAFYDEGSPIYQMSETALVKLFVSEIMDGMQEGAEQKDHGKQKDYEKQEKGGRTGQMDARAGILKMAVDEGGISATKTYEKLFAASLQAAKETGVSLLCHFEFGTDVFPLLKKMEEYGIPQERLLACHLDRARKDTGYHEAVFESGVYLEYDTIHRLKYASDEEELRLIGHMLEIGAEKKLLLSLDTTNERLRMYGADMGLDYICRDFCGMLRERGVSRETIRTLMVENPVRAISIGGLQETDLKFERRKK